jgi:hypothetical protein
LAGYSGTPLVKKLGIKADHRVGVLDAPDGFDALLSPLPDGVDIHSDLRGKAAFDVIVLFSEDESRLQKRLELVVERLTPAGGLWIAWPKKASGMATDLSEAVVRRIGLDTGLVDNKICAVDDTWSGLRFVIRLKDRPRAAAQGTRT